MYLGLTFLLLKRRWRDNVLGLRREQMQCESVASCVWLSTHKHTPRLHIYLQHSSTMSPLRSLSFCSNSHPFRSPWKWMIINQNPKQLVLIEFVLKAFSALLWHLGPRLPGCSLRLRLRQWGATAVFRQENVLMKMMIIMMVLIIACSSVFL